MLILSFYNPYYLILNFFPLIQFFVLSCKLLWDWTRGVAAKILQRDYECVLEFRVAELLIFSRSHGLEVIIALYWDI